MYNFTKLLAVTLIISLLGACSVKKNKDELQNSIEFDQAREEVKAKTLEIVYKIPSPTEVPAMLEATGAEFDPSLVNDAINADYYKSTNMKSALNLGVYAADIGYFASYQKAQNVLNYLSAARQLADQLGASSAFSMTMFSRFEKNISNKDSLANIINEAIHNTDQFLQDHARYKMSAWVLTGGFAEGLFLSTALIKNYPKDILPDDSRNLILLPVIRVILEQEKPLGDLIALYHSIGEKEETNELLAMMVDLKKEYEKINLTEKIQQNRPDLIIAESTLDPITSLSGKIRDYITELK
jgi:hypothetical protein